MLGLRVLPANEHFQRPADKPTLLFPLSANRWHVGNVLERLEFFREQFDDFDPLHGYHFHRRHCCKWQPPPAGWLKLNFSSKARDGVSPAGYGGILRNENGNMIATYSCSLGELVDATVANAEALRVGRGCWRMFPEE
ncbi:hypothetical protein NL676_019061 [Syzygium grande]|nr:hypothetical protein NL676_019061 [Syzygium grande]